MRKKVWLYWFMISLLWASLLFLSFYKATEAENAFSNMNFYFKEKYRQMITGLTTFDDGKLMPSWQDTCKKDWELIPDCEVTPVSGIEGLKLYHVKINSDGFRGREYALEKPDDVFRIVVLGDSFVFGWGVDLEDTLTYQLEKILNEKHSDKKFEVLNFGVPGMNTAQEVERFKEKASKYSPNLVIVGFSKNDDENLEFYNQVYGSDYTTEKEKLNLYTILKEDKNLKNIDFIKQPFEELTSLSKEYKFSILVYAFTLTKEQQELFKKFEESEPNFYSKKASFDFELENLILHHLDKHPSPTAHRLYAEEIYSSLEEYGLLPLN